MSIQFLVCEAHKRPTLCIFCFLSGVVTKYTAACKPNFRSLYTKLPAFSSSFSPPTQGKFSLPVKDLIFYYVELASLRRDLVDEITLRERAMKRTSSLLTEAQVLTDNEFLSIHQMKTRIFSMLLQEASSKRQSACTDLQFNMYAMESEHARLMDLQHCIKSSYEAKYMKYKREKARLEEIDRCLLLIERDMLDQVKLRKKTFKSTVLSKLK